MAGYVAMVSGRRIDFGDHRRILRLGQSSLEAMRPLLALVIVSLASWLAVSLVVDRQTSVEILFGLLGPLPPVAVTWIVAGQVSQRRPQAMMSLMVAGFAI